MSHIATPQAPQTTGSSTPEGSTAFAWRLLARAAERCMEVADTLADAIKPTDAADPHSLPAATPQLAHALDRTFRAMRLTLTLMARFEHDPAGIGQSRPATSPRGAVPAQPADIDTRTDLDLIRTRDPAEAARIEADIDDVLDETELRAFLRPIERDLVAHAVRDTCRLERGDPPSTGQIDKWVGVITAYDPRSDAELKAYCDRQTELKANRAARRAARAKGHDPP